MKRLVLMVVMLCGVGHATTWHFLTTGGSYPAQCDGTLAVPLAGSTGGHCAINHPFWLRSSKTSWVGAVAAGDTLQFDDLGPYYIGQKRSSGPGMDWSTVDAPDCAGSSPVTECKLPPLLSNMKIYGHNRGSCHTSDHSNLLNPTQFIAINGVFWTVRADNISSPDIECIDITQGTTCTAAAAPPGQCVPGTDDYSQYALVLSQSSSTGPSNLILKDVGLHGMAGRGILGAFVSGTTTLDHVFIRGNGMAGWDSDSGGGGNGQESTGTINESFTRVEFNGCVEIKPVTSYEPNGLSSQGYNFCHDDLASGGYGDGQVIIATKATYNISNSYFRWNTQDGIDGLHESDDRTTSPNINITTSRAEGNEGSQVKEGMNNGSVATAVNNVVIGNCRALGTPSVYPMTLNPTGYGSSLVDICRANGDMWAFQFDNGAVLKMYHNTTISYGTTTYDAVCVAGGTCTTGESIVFQDNLSYLQPDSGDGGQLPEGWDFAGVSSDPFLNSGSLSNHNLTYNLKNNACPITSIDGNSICGNTSAQDPKLTNETVTSLANPILLAGSPAIAAGTAVSGVTTDFFGNSYAATPAIGAAEFSSSTPVVAMPTSSPAPGTYSSAQTVSLSTATAGATICYTTDGSTPTSTTPGSCQHGNAYSGAITVSSTQTIMALGTMAGETNSSVASFSYVINVSGPATQTFGATATFGSVVIN